MIEYGLYTGLTNGSYKTNNTQTIIPVRVTDIILSEDHPDWKELGGWDALGVIKFIPYYSTLVDKQTSINIAKPLFANIKNYPLIEEITWVITLPDPVSANNPNFSSYYYINSLNLWNHPHHNAFPPNNVLNLPPNQQLNYKEIESGLIKQQDSSSKDIKLGDTFKENSSVHPLLPFEGDVIFEGRFGQSFRFGSTVPNKNGWSNAVSSSNGDPITIIKNGESFNSPKEGWIPIIEDINNDKNSIYLCTNQVIPIKVASTNWKSFT